MTNDSTRPKIVVTIHGIRTTGVWQKEITPYLARHGLIPHHIDYGYFPALAFLFPFTRDRRLEKVRQELRLLVHITGAQRISVIAHSFGTFLAMEALLAENGALKFDRIVLTGSIVPRDFDWDGVLRDGALALAARNERATKDWVVSVADFVSRRLKWVSWLNAGDSGRNPFTKNSPALLDYFTVGGHSEVHNPLKFEEWARFIAYPLLPKDILDKILIEFDALREEAARTFETQKELIRINLFAPISGALRIVPGATINMTYAPELDVEIEPGHGATGAAFATNNPAFVIKSEKDWGGNLLPGRELAKLHPKLKWVLAYPVYNERRKGVAAVVCIDGLDTVPRPLQADRNSDPFKGAVMLPLAYIKDRIKPYLDYAFRGEQPPQMG